MYSGFHGGSKDKESACSAGDLGSIPGSGRSPGEGNGNPLQYSYLENPTDRGDWWTSVHGDTKSVMAEWLTLSHSCTHMSWTRDKAPKNWSFWLLVLEKTLESPPDCKEIKPVHPKGNQPWISTGRTDAEAEAPILWPHDVKSWLIGKDPDTGKDWRQVEKEVTEDEMVGWHHWLNGHEFEQTPGDIEGQGSLVCCSPWGCKEWDTT